MTGFICGNKGLSPPTPTVPPAPFPVVCSPGAARLQGWAVRCFFCLFAAAFPSAVNPGERGHCRFTSPRGARAFVALQAPAPAGNSFAKSPGCTQSHFHCHCHSSFTLSRSNRVPFLSSKTCLLVVLGRFSSSDWKPLVVSGLPSGRDV